MTAVLLTALLVFGIPLLLLFLFKSNAAIMFLAACAGIVLLGSLDPTIVATAGSVVPGEGEAYIRLSVVTLSLIFAALMSKNHVKKVTGFILHGLLVILTALMLWSSLPSLSGVSWLVDSTDMSSWQTLDDFKTLVIALGFSMSLIVLLKGRTVKH